MEIFLRIKGPPSGHKASASQRGCIGKMFSGRQEEEKYWISRVSGQVQSIVPPGNFSLKAGGYKVDPLSIGIAKNLRLRLGINPYQSLDPDVQPCFFKNFTNSCLGDSFSLVPHGRKEFPKDQHQNVFGSSTRLLSSRMTTATPG